MFIALAEQLELGSEDMPGHFTQLLKVDGSGMR